MWWLHINPEEEDGYAHVSAYVYIETTIKFPAKIKQVPFENVPQF